MNKYYLTNKGNIREYKKDLNPSDPLTDGALKAGDDVARLALKDEQNFSDEEVQKMRENGKSVIPVTIRSGRRRGYTPLGENDAEPGADVKGFYIRTADIQLIHHKNKDVNGQTVQAADGVVPDYVLDDEDKLKSDLKQHNEILDGHAFKINEYNPARSYAYQHTPSVDQIGLPSLRKNQKKDEYEVKYLGDFESREELNKSYGVRFGYEKPYKFDSPMLEEKDGRTDLNIHIKEVPNSFKNTMKSEHMDAEHMDWNVVLRPMEKDGKVKEQYAIRWEDTKTGKKGAIKLDKKGNRELRDSICRFAEENTGHSDKVTAQTFHELADKLRECAMYPEPEAFFTKEDYWKNAREQNVLSTPEFANKWLRTEHSLYNDYTGEAIVPDVDQKTGFMKGLYSFTLERKDKEEIEKRSNEKKQEEPIAEYVKSVKANRSSAKYDRITFYSVDKMGEKIQQITNFPEINRTSGHGGSAEALDASDIAKENAHWGLDRAERLYSSSSFPEWRQKTEEEVDILSNDREKASDQLSLGGMGDEMEKDAIREEEKDKKRESREKKRHGRDKAVSITDSIANQLTQMSLADMFKGEGEKAEKKEPEPEVKPPKRRRQMARMGR